MAAAAKEEVLAVIQAKGDAMPSEKQQQQRAAAASAAAATSDPRQIHVAATMGGYCEVVSLIAGGPQALSFGLGPGECKGDRPKARQERRSAAAQGAAPDALDALAPWADAPWKHPKDNAFKRQERRPLRPPSPYKRTVDDLSTLSRRVTLHAGGAQAVSYGLGPGECKGDRPKARTHALLAEAKAAQQQ